MFVHLDPRRAGVLVPKRFLDKPQLVLQIGLNMFIPIPDLKVDEEGISCTLSFDRAPFWCRLPWNAVYALVGEDGRGMMWPNDIPAEVVAQMQNPPQQAGQQRPAPTKKPRPRLAAVPADGPEEAAEEPEAAPEEARAAEPAPAEAQAPEEAPAEAAEKPEEEPAPARPGQVGSRKPKRELPPYLRVIK